MASCLPFFRVDGTRTGFRYVRKYPLIWCVIFKLTHKRGERDSHIESQELNNDVLDRRVNCEGE